MGGADAVTIHVRRGTAAAAAASRMIPRPRHVRPDCLIASTAITMARPATGIAARKMPSPAPPGTRPARARSGPATAAAAARMASGAPEARVLMVAGDAPGAGFAGRSVTSRLPGAEQLLPAVGRLHRRADAARPSLPRGLDHRRARAGAQVDEGFLERRLVDVAELP